MAVKLPPLAPTSVEVAPPTTTHRLSPSRLSDFLGCEYRTYLDLRADRGEIPREDYRPPDAALLAERGLRHEQAFLDSLREEGRDVVSIPEDHPAEERAAQTEQAMRRGREVIHQAAFIHDNWIGYADFLIRIDTPSALGDYSYEVHDAKLGHHAKPTYIFQLLFYTDQVERIQHLRPGRMHLVLGDGERPPFQPEDFDAYAAQVVHHFEQRRAELDGGATPAYPYRVSDCQLCPWWKHCADKRRDEDHLSLVAMLSRNQGLKLEAEGIHTVGDVATLPADTSIPRLNRSTLANLTQQARLQIDSRGLPAPLYELLEPEHDRGLARLPRPSRGDVFFDFEGDPWWGDEGLEYLFGTVHSGDDDQWHYWPLWAESRAEEKSRFEEWVDWITARLEQHPDLHVFHFNTYEPVTIKKLMARHATREHEVDELLRREVFVDLYAVTRQALRAGLESYGLKALESLIGFERRAPLREAVGSLRGWQRYLDDGDRGELDAIAAYNEDDCRSTRVLRDWLMDRVPEAERQYGVTIAALGPKPPTELSDKAQQYLAKLELARTALTADLPDDESQDDEEQRARRLAFDLLGYHRREAKPAWWEHYSRLDMSMQDLRDYETEAIADLTPVSGAPVETIKQSYLFTLEFPPQEFKLGTGDDALDEGERGVTIVSLDEQTRRVLVKRGKKQGLEPPRALLPGTPYSTDAQVAALFCFADRVAARGLEPCGELDSSTDLLLARAPRFAPGTPALTGGHVDIDVLREQVAGLDGSALFVQGPPGSGKTWAGARVAVELMRRGRRVGVVATSHKAIVNLLDEIDACAAAEGFAFRGWKKAGDGHENNYASDTIVSSEKPPKDADLNLIAGTAWLWAKPETRQNFGVDVLFADEAGQMSLADAIAVAQGARSIVLLGDPQQLAHVSQGTHPHGSGVSVLEHILGDNDTVPPGRGVFLDKTYRMHPEVCSFISETMYDSRLTPIEGGELQVIESSHLSGAGLRIIEIEHEDNRQRSIDEAEAIRLEVDALLDGGRWTNRFGVTYDLALKDILVVAPYNAQVRVLKSVLPEGARVGTVDKFQGQQAPVVFFSMASSSGEDIPRGMDFLFSRNRLNVAVSRAQALAVVVCSPRLLRSRCSTIEQMRLVNMLCRFAGAAQMRLTS